MPTRKSTAFFMKKIINYKNMIDSSYLEVCLATKEFRDTGSSTGLFDKVSGVICRQFTEF